jgi:uncharacterized membrane protein
MSGSLNPGISPRQRSAIWSGVIAGIGLMGALDSIIFHQMLQWHNFYYDTTEFWRIFSDGVLQGFTAGMLLLGSVRLWMHRGRISHVLGEKPFWSGIILGAGAFQLIDGIVIHKILQLHQIREGVDNNLPYDLAWNGFAIVLLIVGFMLFRQIEPEPENENPAHTKSSEDVR